MRISSLFSLALLALLQTQTAHAAEFTLSSQNISHGDFMPKAQEFAGFGCTGDNLSPQLSWQGAPANTEAFALMVYDPDAPTGSGWWHWQLVNIPKHVTQLAAGIGSLTPAPKGSLSIANDYGVKGFGGACPPPGHGAHRYQFTLHALSKKLSLPENASAALTGYSVLAHSLASSTLEALYKRP